MGRKHSILTIDFPKLQISHARKSPPFNLSTLFTSLYPTILFEKKVILVVWLSSWWPWEDVFRRASCNCLVHHKPRVTFGHSVIPLNSCQSTCSFVTSWSRNRKTRRHMAFFFFWIARAGGASRHENKQDIIKAGEKSGGSWDFDDFREEFEFKI